MAELLDLGRRGHTDALRQTLQALRTSGGFTAAIALEAACAWLLAGDARQADLAYLQADQLMPTLSLVPDVWGLWPAGDVPVPPPDMVANLKPWRERYWLWRYPDPQALWQVILPQLQADWRAALEPEGWDSLLILGRATSGVTAPTGGTPLHPPLEPELARLVADSEIAVEPAASNRFWQLVATIRPHWDLARIRAADLALARGELELSSCWLNNPPATALANPWFQDVVARQAVASGDVEKALSAWAEANRLAQADATTASLTKIFEKRRCEARRGTGVLKVRSLANRGETAAAKKLLERLLEEDPHWQPLQRLREQLQGGAPPAVTKPSPAKVSEVMLPFRALLDRATALLQTLGAPVPEVAATPLPEELPEAAAELEGLSHRLSDYEARFALA